MFVNLVNNLFVINSNLNEVTHLYSLYFIRNKERDNSISAFFQHFCSLSCTECFNTFHHILKDLFMLYTIIEAWCFDRGSVMS